MRCCSALNFCNMPWPTCRLPAGKTAFCSANTFRDAWMAFNRHLEHATNFTCPECEAAGGIKVAICDGTYLVFKAHQCTARAMAAPADGQLAPLPRGTDRLTRCAVTGGGQLAAGRRGALQQLSVFVRGTAERQRGGGEGVLTAEQALDALQQVPAVLQGAVALMCCAVGMPRPAWSMANPPTAAMYEAAEQAGLSADQRRWLARFLFSLGSESAVCSYIAPAAAHVLKAACSTGLECLDASGAGVLAQEAPIVHAVLTILQSMGIHSFACAPWCLFWSSLAEHAIYNCTGSDAGGMLAADQVTPPSCASDECLHFGICTGLERVRERWPCEADANPAADAASTSVPACRHAFGKSARTTGGVFTVSCQHGVCYGFCVMPSAEGRNVPYSFFVQYFKQAPKVIVYDFACALQEYCLNRAPEFFKDTRFVVDRFHWANHTACGYGYDMTLYCDLDTANSQVAEQQNSRLRQLADAAATMRQDTFMMNLRYYFACLNHSKVEKLRKRMAHIEALSAHRAGRTQGTEAQQ